MTHKDLDNEIMKIIENRGVIRRTNLHLLLKESKESKITINRHIQSLSKYGKIRIFKYPEYERLGFFPKDKRASFLVSEKTIRDINYQEEVFKLLESKNKVERENAIVEIDGMLEHIYLTPLQIEKLSELILKEDKEISENMIRMIYNAINKNQTLPSEIGKFQKNIISYLKKHDTGKESDLNNNSKAYLIFCLGLFNNEIIIDMLKRDIDKRNLNDEQLFKMGYNFWTISKLINNHKEDLFKFSKLFENKKYLVVARVRRVASENLKTYELFYPHYEKMIKENMK